MACLTPEELVREFRKRVIEWGKEHYEDWPWRRDRTPYRVLIAEFLLKRTTRQAVSREYPRFIEKFPDIRSIYEADINDLVEALRPLGLYNQRARQLKDLAAVVVEEYGGQIPEDIEALKSLPGVLDYIAGAVMSFGFGRPAPIPDTNVLRIIARASDISRHSAKGKRRLVRILEKLVPDENHQAFNYALLDLGGSVCHYQSPKCHQCPLRDLCVFNLKTQDPRRAECVRLTYLKLAGVKSERYILRSAGT